MQGGSGVACAGRLWGCMCKEALGVHVQGGSGDACARRLWGCMCKEESTPGPLADAAAAAAVIPAAVALPPATHSWQGPAHTSSRTRDHGLHEGLEVGLDGCAQLGLALHGLQLADAGGLCIARVRMRALPDARANTHMHAHMYTHACKYHAWYVYVCMPEGPITIRGNVGQGARTLCTRPATAPAAGHGVCVRRPNPTCAAGASMLPHTQYPNRHLLPSCDGQQPCACLRANLGKPGHACQPAPCDNHAHTRTHLLPVSFNADLHGCGVCRFKRLHTPRGASGGRRGGGLHALLVCLQAGIPVGTCICVC